MAMSFSGPEFIKALTEDKLREPITREGMVKPDADDPNAILFAEGTRCHRWTKIPVELIERVEYLTTVGCQDHEHPLVVLHLKEPPSENKLAVVLSDLLKASPQARGSSEFMEPSLMEEEVVNFMPTMRLSDRVTVPGIIGRYLGELGVDEITGFAQCVGTINGALKQYERCVEGGGSSEGCARAAAKWIKKFACRSYCDCT